MKHILTPVLASLIALPLASQEYLTLQDGGGNVVNGGNIVYYGSADASVLEQGVYVTLVSGPMRDINVRRYELDVQPNTLNYFCWGICYLEREAGESPVWQAASNHSIELEAGITETAFKAYHVPNGQLGNSSYRYVWFDKNSPSDTVWVDIEFRSTPVGIDERGTAVRNFTVFPNPSQGADVQFTLELDGGLEGVTMAVFNALGEQVYTNALAAQQARATLPTAGLPAGMYFATVQRRGTTLATRRFVVTSGR